MATLKKISRSYLTPAESLSMAERFIMALQIISDPLLMAVTQEVKSAMAVVRTVIGRIDGNPLTQQLAELDSQRDMAFRAFRNYIFACSTRVAQASFVEAGEKLCDILQQAGWRLYNEGYANQSAQTAVLLQKLSAPEAVGAIEQIQAGDWFEEFVDLDKQFNELWNKRAREDGGDDLPLLREAKADLDQAIETLLGVIEMRAARDTAKYGPAVAALNEIITELMSIARARETRQSDSDGGESGEAATSSHMQ